MSFQLTIEPLGATIEVEEGQTVLDAALRQGIYLPHACGHGLCGTCKVQVCGGEVDHGAMIDGRPQAIERNPAGRFQLFRIGDAVASRNIHAAIYDAYRLCSVF